MKGETVVQSAALMVKDKVVKRLIQLISQAGDGDKIDIREVKALFDANANPNVQDENGMTLLHQAVEMRDSKMVKLLLAYGADPNLINKNGSTPFDLAQKMNDERIIDILREKEEKIKKELGQFQNLRGRRKSRIFDGESEARSKLELQFEDVKLRESDAGWSDIGWHLSDPETLWIDSQEWQNSGQIDSLMRNPISERKLRTSYGKQWRMPEFETQTQVPARGQVQESMQERQGKVILRVNQTPQLQRMIQSNINSKSSIMNKMRRVATFGELLRQIFRSEYVNGDRKVFTLSHSPKKDGYSLGKVGTQRQQLMPLTFATRENHDQKKCHKQFNRLSLSTSQSSDGKVFTLSHSPKKDGYCLGKVGTQRQQLMPVAFATCENLDQKKCHKQFNRLSLSPSQSSDGKVFALSHSPKKDGYCLGKVGTQRQQLMPLTFAIHGNWYYEG
jgi:hypothetical protein